MLEIVSYMPRFRARLREGAKKENNSLVSFQIPPHQMRYDGVVTWYVNFRYDRVDVGIVC